MKKFIALFLVFSVLALSGSLFAEARKKGEVCFGGGLFFSEGNSAAFGAVGFGYNVGGGIRIKLSEVFAIRAEYRRYFVGESDWGVNTIIGGISLFF